MRKNKRKPDSKVLVHAFFCQDLTLTVPREIAARVRTLTAKKRVLPDGYDEAVRKFEEELSDLTGGAPLSPETWGGKSRLKQQADLVSAAAVLLSFGVSRYPVPPEEEAFARALAQPGQGAETAPVEPSLEPAAP